MKTCTFLALLLWASSTFGQAFYKQSFGTGTSFPTGWSSTDSRIGVTTTSPSSGYSSSPTSPQASGGSNVIFQECSPNSNTVLYLNAAGVVNTTGKSNIRVGFGCRKTNSFDKPVLFEYSLNGVDWVNIDLDVSVGATETWSSAFYDLPAEAAGVSNLRFRFGYISNVNNNCTAAPNFRIDDFTVGENSSLPVTLVNFWARSHPSSVELAWTTATESNSDYFVVERSPNGSNFEAIATVGAAGLSYATRDYTFTDERPLPGKNYYRLRQVDYDGQFSYSPVVTATFGKSHYMRLAPLPAVETLNIQLETPAKDDGIWQVYDMNGRLILNGQILAETTEQPIHISERPEGAYVLRLTVGQEVMVEQFRKNK